VAASLFWLIIAGIAVVAFVKYAQWDRARRPERALAAWRHESADLQDELEFAIDPPRSGDTAAGSLALHKGEGVLLVGSGAALVEPKRLPGQWVGGSSGFSFRVMKGVRYNVGRSRGTYSPGAEVATSIAVGTVTITNQRVVFQSDREAREFSFTKLLGYQHDPARPLTYFQMSNRKKVSGIGYDGENARTIRFRLALALAQFRGETEALVRDLKAEIAKHEAARPAQAVA
jgi:hypothetical protein